MYSEELITSVVNEFNAIAAEASPTLRVKTLEDYLENIAGEEKELVNLVLSFQINNLYNVKKPKFNSIPFSYKSLFPSLEQWFSVKKYDGIPFVIQTLIYYMSSTKTLGIPEKMIVERLKDYIDVYFWLSDNLFFEYTEDEDTCKVCHENTADTNGLCIDCISQLYEYTEYRTKDFTLKVTPSTCKWLALRDLHQFETEIGRYKVFSVGKDEIYFELIMPPKEPYQGVLPFEEYQLRII